MAGSAGAGAPAGGGSYLNLLPFGSYPVQTPVASRALIFSLVVFSLIVYGGLTTFNVLTQGYSDISTSVLLPTYIPPSSSEKFGIEGCQPVQLQVGTGVYMMPRGTFNWVITGVVHNNSDSAFQTAFAYKGGKLSCNMTNIGLTYYWSEQTFKYGLCANCTAPAASSFSTTTSATDSLSDAEDDVQDGEVLTKMCTNFDLSSTNLPTWTDAGQQQVQNQIFGLQEFFQQLRFPNDTFPIDFWPPYGQEGGDPPTDTTIAPRDSIFLSIWLGNLRYLPGNQTSSGFGGVGDFGGNHTVYLPDSIVDSDPKNATAPLDFTNNQVVDLRTAFARQYPPGKSGLSLAVQGIGSLHLGGSRDDNPNEPSPVGEMRDKTLGIVNSILQQASEDLEGKEIGSMFLCQKGEKKWKNFVSIIAIVLGNNASTFGIFLWCAAIFAEFMDRRRRQAAAPSQNIDILQQSLFPHYDNAPGASMAAVGTAGAAGAKSRAVLTKRRPGSDASEMQPTSSSQNNSSRQAMFQRSDSDMTVFDPSYQDPYEKTGQNQGYISGSHVAGSHSQEQLMESGTGHVSHGSPSWPPTPPTGGDSRRTSSSGWQPDLGTRRMGPRRTSDLSSPGARFSSQQERYQPIPREELEGGEARSYWREDGGDGR